VLHLPHSFDSPAPQPWCTCWSWPIHDHPTGATEMLQLNPECPRHGQVADPSRWMRMDATWIAHLLAAAGSVDRLVQLRVDVTAKVGAKLGWPPHLNPFPKKV